MSPPRCSIYGTVRTKLPLERQDWSFQAKLLTANRHFSVKKNAKTAQAGTDPVAVIIEKALVVSNVYLGKKFRVGQTEEEMCGMNLAGFAKAAAINLQKEGR